MMVRITVSSSFRQRPESNLQQSDPDSRWPARRIPGRIAVPDPRAGHGARIRRLIALTAMLLVWLALCASTALAHHDGEEVRLWVSGLDFQDAPGGVLVTVRLIEREFGESVSGFGVRVAATDQSGNLVGPIELQESETAVYSGALLLNSGVWEIVATAHQGSSSLPAIESRHREMLEIDATGRLVASADGGSATATTLAIVLPICAVALLVLVLVLRRRRPALDDGADSGGDPAVDDSGLPATGDDPASDRGGR